MSMRALKRKSAPTPSKDFWQEKQALDFINQGRTKEAEDIYKKLIAEGTKNHIVYSNLATLIGISGDKNKMIQLLKQSLNIEPGYAVAHNNLGIAYKDIGQFAEAISSYRKALKIRPDYPEAYNNLGNVLKEIGQLDNAISSYRKALKLKINYPEAYNNLGIALKEIGQFDKAIDSYRKALSIRPDYPEACNNLGNSLKEIGEIDDAIKFCRKALTLKKNYPEAYNNLGNILKEKGELDEAICFYKKARSLSPNNPEVNSNLASAFQDKGDLNAAMNFFKKTLDLNHRSPEIYYNLGNIFQEIGELENAIKSYKKALDLRSNYPEAYKNLSSAQLLNGDYESGWKNYEWRFKTKEYAIPHAQPKIKLWKGEKLIIGEKLLVVSEQGLGDTIQFMRYIPYLNKKGFDVSFSAQTKLHSLIKASDITLNPLTPEEGTLIAEGKWISLLSVPQYLGVTPQNPIISKGYIRTTTELKKKWKSLLKIDQRPLIAINWQGNPNHERRNSVGRSFPLEVFKKVSTLNQVSLVSLQKGFGSEQLNNCSFRNCFVKCQDQIDNCWDFLETAAIISNCDLVITSDTSVAHLAGGLGKTTWLLLKKVPEWRWGMLSEDTFWYRSIKIFRQRERDNWVELADRVLSDLKNLFD